MDYRTQVEMSVGVITAHVLAAKRAAVVLAKERDSHIHYMQGAAPEYPSDSDLLKDSVTDALAIMGLVGRLLWRDQ